MFPPRHTSCHSSICPSITLSVLSIIGCKYPYPLYLYPVFSYRSLGANTPPFYPFTPFSPFHHWVQALFLLAPPLVLSINGCEYPLPHALWARITRNLDWSTGPLAGRFAQSLALLYLLRLRANSFARSLVGQWMIGWLFCLCFLLFQPTVPPPRPSPPSSPQDVCYFQFPQNVHFINCHNWLISILLSSDVITSFQFQELFK